MYEVLWRLPTAAPTPQAGAAMRAVVLARDPAVSGDLDLLHGTSEDVNPNEEARGVAPCLNFLVIKTTKFQKSMLLRHNLGSKSCT